MIPTATSLIASSFISVDLLSENISFPSLKSLDAIKSEILAAPKKDLPEQQIIAGMALSLLFADSVPVFSFDERLVKIADRAAQYLTQPATMGFLELFLKQETDLSSCCKTMQQSKPEKVSAIIAQHIQQNWPITMIPKT